MLTIAPDDKRDVFTLFHPVLPGNAMLRRVTGKSVVEVEPNDLARPQELSEHATISGRIDPPGERDVFVFNLKAGEKRVFSLESRSLGLPLDAVLQVLDATGKTLAETDDAGESRDPELAFTPTADGRYRVVVHDLNDRGGPHFAYLLRVLAPKPDFTLSLATDKFDVTADTAVNVVVKISRIHGLSDAVDVMAKDLTDRMLATTVRSKASDSSSKSVTLVIRVDGCSHPGPFRVVGRSADGNSRSRHAFAPIPGFDTTTDQPWLTILPAVKPKKP
jgi:hypothetical protein